MNLETAGQALEAGANVLVAGSAVFGAACGSRAAVRGLLGVMEQHGLRTRAPGPG